MEKVLYGLHWQTLLLYLDDIIVVVKDFETHMTRLMEVFTQLRKAELKLKFAKCEILRTQVSYLENIVSVKGVTTDPQKLAALWVWDPPRHLTDLQAFLGTTGYYQQYIDHYATIVKPLHQLSSKKVT